MQRRKFSLLLLAPLAGTASGQSGTSETLASRVQSSVVSVLVTLLRPRGPTNPDGQLAPASTVATDGTVRGAGTLISSDGLILTAASLLEGAAKITVTLAGGRALEASVVGHDRHTNLALLRIDAQGLSFLRPESASDLSLGERLMIVGRSVLDQQSSPIVSDGLVRLVSNPNMDAAPFIQTPAAVLPGMGGGPLLREKTGAFVGVVTQQYVPKVGAPITFAVPLDEYLPIAQDLQTNGRVDRGTIGTRINLLDAQQAQSLGLPLRPAIVIVGTRPGGPAEKAGLLIGDIVLAVNDVEVTSVVSYFRSTGMKRSGTPVDIQVYRKGRTLKFQMVSERVE